MKIENINDTTFSELKENDVFEFTEQGTTFHGIKISPITFNGAKRNTFCLDNGGETECMFWLIKDERSVRKLENVKLVIQ